MQRRRRLNNSRNENLAMSKIYKFTVAIATFILAFLGLCFVADYNGRWILLPLFLMPICWTLWLGCVVFDSTREIWRLSLLWLSIDLTVLVALSLLAANVHRVDGPNGAEVLLVIVFSPVILPLILVSAAVPLIGTWVSEMAVKISYQRPPSALTAAFYDWISFSVIAAISSFLLMNLYYLLMSLIKRRSAEHTLRNR